MNIQSRSPALTVVERKLAFEGDSRLPIATIRSMMLNLEYLLRAWLDILSASAKKGTVYLFNKTGGNATPR